MIDILKKYYSGFYIDNPVGNNSFSYNLRRNKKIFVAPLLQGDLSDLKISNEIVFSEIENDVERNCFGLKNFIFLRYKNKNIFIFDNHNHAFFFWAFSLENKLFKRGVRLLHVDQHKDMREPQEYFLEKNLNDSQKFFEYTNFVLNVGSFILPALKLNFFNSVDIVDNEESFLKKYEEEFVLDIDMDIFSEDMNYIHSELKINSIREWVRQSQFITIATSPYFMDQTQAIKLIKEILT